MSLKKEVIVLLFVFLLVLSTVKAVEIEQVVEETLQIQEEVDVIVLLKGGEIDNKKEMIERQQEKVIGNLKFGRQRVGVGVWRRPKLQNFELKHKYSTVNAIAGKVNKDGLEELKQDPDVKKVYLDKIMHIDLDVSIGQVNADDVWNISINDTNITGHGETICVVDTGIDTDHNAFTGRIIQQYCYCGLGGGCCPDNTAEDDDAEDDEGHGTHVSGIAAGNYSSYVGVAPKANIVSMKVCNSGGSCATSDVISGIDWCTNNASRFNISVISISLGDQTEHNTFCNDDSIAPSINSAVGENVTVVVSAGNCNWGGATCTSGVASPACVENATPVGAVNDNDVINYQRGNTLSILAPGVSITSAYNNGGTATASGTSMSAPHVSGAVALLQQFKKLENGTRLTPYEIETTINKTGKTINDSGGTGLNYSRLDVLAAVQALDTQAPKWLNNGTSNTTIRKNDTVQFNITFNDTVGLSSYIFSWNDSGTWVNKTNGTLTSNYQTISLNETITATRNKDVYWKFYFNDTNNNWNETDEFKFTVQNSVPIVTLLTPTDGQIFTYNPTINYSCTDNDNDVCTFYTYINDTLNTTSANNITSLTFDDGNYTLIVMAGDGYDNSSNSTNISFIIDATAPTYTNFISNCSNKTKTGENVYWAAVFTDSEQAQYWLMYSQNLVWTNDTSKNYVSGANMTENITINATRGQDVNGTFYFNDSSGNLGQTGYIGCTINNTQPSYSGNPSINNTIPSKTDTMNCSLTGATFSDADSDSEGTLQYIWYRNNAEISGQTNSVLDLSSYAANDKFLCGVRAYDSYDYADYYVNSSNVAIIDNRTPSFTDFNTNATNNTKAEENINLSFIPSDNKASGQTWYSKYNGTDYFNSSPVNWNNNQIYTFNITIAEARNTDINLSIFFNDSSGNLNQTNWIGFTVNNTLPYNNFSVSLNSPVGDDNDLNGTISDYSDFDNDVWQLNETRWYVNGTLNSNYDNLTNISKDNTAANEQWIFSARVYDGEDWSDWKNSSIVTINDSSTPSVIRNYTLPSSVNINNALIIYLNLTDDSSTIDNTTIKAGVEFNNVKTNHTMTLHSGNNTAGKVTGWTTSYTPTAEGTYYVKYYYCDISNNCGNTSDRAVSFTATVETVTTASAGGGGGGGGGGGSAVSSENIESHFYSIIYKGDTTTMGVSKENIAVNKIIFTAKKQISAVTITVEKLDEFTDELPNTYQYLSIETENMENTDFDTAFIEFSVSKVWLNSNNFDKAVLNRYFNNKWEKLKTDKIRETNETVDYRALTPGFSVFAVTGEKEEIKEEEKIVEEVAETPPETEEGIKEEVMLSPEREIKQAIKLNVILQAIASTLFITALILILRGNLRKRKKRKKKK